MNAPFVASNGWEVERLSDGQCSLRKPVVGTGLDARTWCGPDEYEAIAEFVRNERDEELGRWRSPTHPDLVVYVVYPGNPGYVQVFSESTCYTAVYNEDGARGAERATIFAEVAVEYFDAHKPEEPKPWLDAALGEVWELTSRGGATEAWIVEKKDDKNHFFGSGFYMPLDNSIITAGKRIWPVSETTEEEES